MPREQLPSWIRLSPDEKAYAPSRHILTVRIKSVTSI